VLFYDEKEEESAMPIIIEKDEAHKLIDRMPPNATRNDLVKTLLGSDQATWLNLYMKSEKMGLF
jgi:hypothetical protein